MDDLERQRELRRERDALANDTPNCPRCLRRMEPAEVQGEPVWQCSGCGNLKDPSELDTE